MLHDSWTTGPGLAILAANTANGRFTVGRQAGPLDRDSDHMLSIGKAERLTLRWMLSCASDFSDLFSPTSRPYRVADEHRGLDLYA